MENEKGTGTGYALPLFVLGAALGAIVGVILAPDSGKETRRKLAGWMKEKKEKTADEVKAKKEQVEAALEAGRKAFHNADKKAVGA